MRTSSTRRHPIRALVSTAAGAALAVTGLGIGAAPATAAPAPTGTDQNVMLAIANYGGPVGMTATFLETDTGLVVCGDGILGGACNFLFTSEIGGVADTTEPGPAFTALPLAQGFGNGAFGEVFTPTISGSLTGFTMNLSCLDQTASGIYGLEAAIFETDEAGLTINVPPLAGGPVDLADCPTDTTSTNDTWTPASFAPITLPVSGAALIAGHHYVVLFGGSFVGGIQPPGLTTTPNAPTSLTATPGNARLTVGFTAPSEDGGSAITDYEWTTDDGATWHSSGRTTSPLTITGLTNATEYSVKVRAVNANGNGVASEAATGTPQAPPAPPEPPVSSTVRPVIATWKVTAGHQSTLRLLRYSGSPKATLTTSTPTACSVKGSLVLFHVAGTCHISVVQGGTTWKTFTAEVSTTAGATGMATADHVRSIPFAPESTTLSDAAKATLRSMAPGLKAAHAVVVHGFAAGDLRSGRNAYTWRLTEDRAQAVATYLRSLGVRVVLAHGFNTWLPLDAKRQFDGINRRADVAWI